MKIHFLLLWSFTMTISAYGQNTLFGNPHVNNQIIISFTDNSSQLDRATLTNSLGTILQGESAMSTIGKDILLDVPIYPLVLGGTTINSEVELIGNLNGQHANVDHADLNYIISAEQMSFPEFLGANGMSEYSPISTSCEESYPGGRLLGCSPDDDNSAIKVGILDTGLDPFYPSINKFVAGEVNVLTDDAMIGQQPIHATGYNTFNPITLDENGHGTAVAGIIAGLSDRAGIDENHLELYIIKCFDANGQGTLYNMLQAVNAANDLNLDVLNLSWSYLVDDEDINAQNLARTLRRMSNEDHVIVVAGAGNDAENLENYNLAPANLVGVNNLITVAAVDDNCNGDLASFSNYGTPVEIAAPGAAISAPGLNGYWSINASGTSFATPIVTAAVIQSWLSHEEEFANGIAPNTVHPVCNYVVNTATPVNSLSYYGIGGVVNFKDACSATQEEVRAQIAQNNDFAINIGADKVGTSNRITATPNPFYNNFSLHFQSVADETTHVELLTLQGVRVWMHDLSSASSSQLEVVLPASLPSGSYLLRTQQGSVINTEILVKQ